MSDTRTTVDGITVKIGDVVWSDHRGGMVCKTKMNKTHLGMWWEWISKQIYSTERAALFGAIQREQLALDKARKELTRATKAIARLQKRLGGLP